MKQPESYRYAIRKFLTNNIIFLVQLSAWFILFFPLRVLFRSKCVIPESIRSLERGSLIVANHQSMADPFIIMGNLPFRTFYRIIPARFPTDNDYMKIPVIGGILRVFGCYDVGMTPSARMRALLRTCDLLRSQETVFVFPEGSIAKSDMKEFLHGIEFFLRETESVIFVRMDGFNEPIVKHLISTKRRLIYGEVRKAKSIRNDAGFLQKSFDLFSGAAEQ